MCVCVFVRDVLPLEGPKGVHPGYCVTLIATVMSCRGVRPGELPSRAAASVVWCGRPVNTWTAEAPPQCRHTAPRYPGPNCTPATIPPGSPATPEDEAVDRGRTAQRRRTEKDAKVPREEKKTHAGVFLCEITKVTLLLFAH